MTTETINLICEKLAEWFGTTAEAIQQYLPDFLHRYGLYMACKTTITTFAITAAVSAICVPLFILMLLDLLEDTKIAKKIFIAIVIAILVCIIVCNIPHFIFPEFYAIEQLISS